VCELGRAVGRVQTAASSSGGAFRRICISAAASNRGPHPAHRPAAPRPRWRLLTCPSSCVPQGDSRATRSDCDCCCAERGRRGQGRAATTGRPASSGAAAVGVLPELPHARRRAAPHRGRAALLLDGVSATDTRERLAHAVCIVLCCLLLLQALQGQV